MKLQYIAPESMGELEILDIVNQQGKELEKADCNMQDIYVQTSLPLN